MPDTTVTIAAPGCGCEIEVGLTITDGAHHSGDPHRTAPVVDRIETPKACPSCGRTFTVGDRFVVDSLAEVQWQQEQDA